MTKTYFALLVAAALVGCGDDTAVQTVDWFKTHDTERKDMISKCDSSPGEHSLSPNCVNARQAQNEKDGSRRGYLELPPADLNEGDK